MKPLDKINRKILNILQENSAITNADLAQKIGLAPASTLERVRKLEKNGIIKKYVALVDAPKVGKRAMVFVIVNMASHTVDSIREFMMQVQQLPEVLECYRLAGNKDYILKIVTDDIKSYESFSVEKLARLPGVARMNTYFVLGAAKEQTCIPISEYVSNDS